MPMRILKPGGSANAAETSKSESRVRKHERLPTQRHRDEATGPAADPAISTGRFSGSVVRQAARSLLGLQRNVGNRHVQNILQPNQEADVVDDLSNSGGKVETGKPASSTASAQPPHPLILRRPEPPTSAQASPTVVQGDDTPNYQPTEGTFIPIIRQDEDVTIKVYEHHIHSFSMDNTGEAPDGSTFHWGGGILGSGGQLQFVGMDDQDGGLSTNIWVQGRKPGRGQVQATLVYQVPAGPRGLSPTKYANVTVAAPTVELVSIHSLSSGTFKLHVGDTFKARISIGNVDAEHADAVNGLSEAGEGTDCVTFRSFEPVSNSGSAQVVDVVYEAKKVGIVNMDIGPTIGDMPLGGNSPKANLQIDVVMNKQEFLNRCSQCNTMIDKAFTRLNTIMEKLSAAYGNAYEGHLDTLRAQDASNRLVGEILLGAALAFIPGGVGGVVGNFMKDAGAGHFLADAIKDMAKAGVKGVQGALPGGGSSMPPALATDPRTWRANYVETVNGSKEAILASLEAWQQAANTDAENFAMNFDPVEHTTKSLVDKDGNPYESTAVPDQLEHQKKFELGFWKEWLSTYGYTAEFAPGCPYGSWFARENQGKKIRDRINWLGEDGDDFLSRYGGISKRAAEAEAERRNEARFGG